MIMETERLNDEIVRSNPNTNFIEFPDNGVLTADYTYVIRQDHRITTNQVFIPAGVTLYFMGGILMPNSPSISTLSLVGNRTRIIAPIVQIFSKTTTATGSWEIDRAYPQWFGAVSYSTIDNNSEDSADEINKAIMMKSTGEVFIPRGVYRVDSTIRVKAGIVLVGDTGKYNTPGLIESLQGTTLMAGATNISNYTNNFLMFLNMNLSGLSWEQSYPNPGTIVKNIQFFNSFRQLTNIKGICAGGGFELDTCLWYGFAQAVYNIPEYADLIRIVSCIFQYPGTQNSSFTGFSYDLGALGDGLIFEGNGASDENKQTNIKALHVNMFNAGSIKANILNNDIFIENCKAISYISNHSEYGSQLVIHNSNVSTMNNYFWKGTRPSIVIKSGDGQSSVVKSNLDLFLFYEDKSSTDTIMKGISEYDVKIDNNSMLGIEQSYRYRVSTSSVDPMYVFGIKIIDSSHTPTPIHYFNDQSYLLSTQGKIMPGLNVVNSGYMNKLENPTSWGYGTVDHCKWFKASGTYHYKYQILWDRRRRIVGQSGILTWYNIGNSISMTKDGDGLLINVVNAEECGKQVMLRLYRGTSLAYDEYIDIPVNGAQYLYDNGISISGFKWAILTVQENITIANTNITSIRYSGINIECKAPAPPTTGTWEEGDVIFNTNPLSTNPNTAHWIYLNGGWRSKP